MTNRSLNRSKLTFRYLFGVAGGPRSFRPHLIDLDWGRVTWWGTDPESTKYYIRWYCGRPSPRYQPRFLNKIPEGLIVCRACTEVAYARAQFMMGLGPLPHFIRTAHEFKLPVGGYAINPYIRDRLPIVPLQSEEAPF